MAIYSFVLPFREAKFCSVLSRIVEKLGCAVGEENLRNAEIGTELLSIIYINFVLQSVQEK
jgi:hypothetical protein